jgi:hypothetical protein
MALDLVLGETNLFYPAKLPQRKKNSSEAQNTAILPRNQPIAVPGNPILLP